MAGGAKPKRADLKWPEIFFGFFVQLTSQSCIYDYLRRLCPLLHPLASTDLF